MDFGSYSSPATESGRVNFDSVEEALSYYPDTNQDVVVRIGQQLYLRVNNVSGVNIPKGSAVKISSASGGLPNVTLAISTHSGDNRIAGLAADLIPNGGVGLVLTNGLLNDINLSSYSVGDVLYLSDTTLGGYSLVTGLSFSSRRNEIGYVISNSSTIGRLYVNINNEDINLTITDSERNILEGNVVSTGVYTFSPGIQKVSNTTFSISEAKGWVVRNTYTYSTAPDVQNVIFAGATGLSTPYLNSDTQTYILLSSTGSIILQTTFPTPQERRESIYLGRLSHPDKTQIQNGINSPDFDVSPFSALRDLWTPIKLINQGIVVASNGSNMKINTSSGSLWGNGINWVNNELNPDSIYIGGQTPATFRYRTQTGTQSNTDTTDIDPNNYDVGGVVTPISGSQYTNQRIYLFTTGTIRIQYGQTTYTTLAKAVTGILAEPFQEYININQGAILIGVISVKGGTTDLSNDNNAQFTAVSKFGELLGGAAGGVSTTTLQGAYDNSNSNPEILTNTPLGPVNIRRGSAADTDNVLTVQNGVGTDTLKIQGDGRLTLNGPIVLNTSSTSGLITGTTSVVSFTASIGNGAYFDYHLSGASNQRRTGTVMATWDSTNVQYTDTSTPDLNGSTKGIEFNVAIITGNVTLQSVVTSGTWSVDTGIRII